jgi:recombinational DNA repair ATPase RecF
MKLSNLFLKNFKGSSELNVPIHPQLTVLVGEVGKTSVLEAVCLGLNNPANGIRLPNIGMTLSRFDDSCINTKEEASTIQVNTFIDISWKLYKKRGELLQQTTINKNNYTDVAMPAVIYYPADRHMIESLDISTDKITKNKTPEKSGKPDK